MAMICRETDKSDSDYRSMREKKMSIYRKYGQQIINSVITGLILGLLGYVVGINQNFVSKTEFNSYKEYQEKIHADELANINTQLQDIKRQQMQQINILTSIKNGK